MESRLGRYVVLKQLASGGRTEVLLGRSDGGERGGHHAILKRLRPDDAHDPQLVRRFLDAARRAAMLRHPHIVTVHDLDETAVEPFVAMDYVHSDTVQTLLADVRAAWSQIPIDLVIAIVSAAAAGLHDAHELRASERQPPGLVHGDVSPSNLLIGYDGSIQLVDFGLEGAWLGKPRRSARLPYLSPEQCRGAPADRRSDVYALGAVFYELATLSPPFKDDSDDAILAQIAAGRAKSPRLRRANLPGEISAIIMRALAVDPAQRYATTNELRASLDLYATGAGLTGSAPVLAAYLRKQLGERPEPWRELAASSNASVADARVADDGAVSAATGPKARLGTSGGHVTGPISWVSDAELAAAAAAMPVAAPASTEAAERAPGSVVPRGGAGGKLAMIGVPLLALVGVVGWRLMGSDGAVAPHAATTAPPSLGAPAPGPPIAVDAMPGTTGQPEVPDPGVAAEPAETAPSAGRTVASAVHAGRPRSSASTKRPASVTVAEAKQLSAIPLTAKPESPAAPEPSLPVAPPPPVNAPHQAPAPVAPAPAAPAPAVAQERPPTAPAPAQPLVITASLLDANRIAGDRDIRPDNATRVQIRRSGANAVVGIYQICITPDGSILKVAALKSTGFTDYDAKIQDVIRTSWRYRPYVVNGKPAAVCSAAKVSFAGDGSRWGNKPTW